MINKWSEHYASLREGGYSVQDMAEVTNRSTAFVKKHLQRWDDRAEQSAN